MGRTIEFDGTVRQRSRLHGAGKAIYEVVTDLPAPTLWEPSHTDFHITFTSKEPESQYQACGAKATYEGTFLLGERRCVCNEHLGTLVGATQIMALYQSEDRCCRMTEKVKRDDPAVVEPELKSCPLCGGKAKMIVGSSIAGIEPGYWVECVNHDARGAEYSETPIGHAGSIAAWNRRA